MAFEVIEPLWPVVFAACSLAVLVFLRTVARVRQEQIDRHNAFREATGMRLDYVKRTRSRAAGEHGGYELVG